MTVASFKQLLDLLAPYQPGAVFPRPATEEAVDKLQVHAGRMLPPSLLAAYRTCDGGPEVPGDICAGPLFYTYEFLSVNEAISLMESWANIRRGGAIEHLRDPIPTFPAGSVQDLESCADWIPFASDGGGGHLAIDFAPGPNGVVGQIINFGAHDPAKFQLAKDFDGFLERVVNDYRNKRLHYVFGHRMALPDYLLRHPLER